MILRDFECELVKGKIVRVTGSIYMVETKVMSVKEALTWST